MGKRFLGKKLIRKSGLAAVLFMVLCFGVCCDNGMLSCAAKKDDGEEVEYDDDFIYDEDELDDAEYDEELDDEDYDGEEYDEEEVDDTINLKTDVKEKGDHQYKAEVTIKNLTDFPLGNWAVDMEFGNPSETKIEALSGAEIVTYSDGRYLLNNAGSNRDIPARGSVSFEMTVSYKTEMSEPVYWRLNNELEILEGEVRSLSYAALQFLHFTSGLPKQNRGFLINSIVCGYLDAYIYL